MKKIAAVAALAAAATLVYLLAARGPASKTSADAQRAAPLSGPALYGQALSLADFKGKVVLVDFWATWCDPCREEIPGLAELHRRLAPRGFSILGVSMDEEGVPAVKKFISRQPLPYPVILNGGERAPAGWIVPGLPTAYLIARDGTALKRWFGAKDPAELEHDVNAALAK